MVLSLGWESFFCSAGDQVVGKEVEFSDAVVHGLHELSAHYWSLAILLEELSSIDFDTLVATKWKNDLTGFWVLLGKVSKGVGRVF